MAVEKIGIVLLFDEKTQKEAIRLSNAIGDKAEAPGMMLNPTNRIPHLTLMHVLLDSSKLEAAMVAVTEAVEDVLYFRDRISGKLKSSPLTGTFDEVRAYHQYVFWTAQKFGRLIRLQDEIIRRVAPLRAGDLTQPWPLRPEQQESLDACGYTGAGKAFHPHITLGRVAPEHAHKRLLSANWDWTSDCVAIGPVENHGILTDMDYRIR